MKKQYILDKLDDAFRNTPILGDAHYEVLEHCSECGEAEYAILFPICEGVFFGDLQRVYAIEEVDDILMDPWCDDEFNNFVALKVFLTEEIEDWDSEEKEKPELLN